MGSTRLKVRFTSNAHFTVKLDHVQIVGVDQSESDLDWNHDGVVNYSDITAFVEDLMTYYSLSGNQPANTNTEQRGLDSNNDGVIGLQDACSFVERLEIKGLITQAEVCYFYTNTPQINPQVNCLRATNPCGGGQD